ncbi:gliding motility-associated C-terminal domain-containing protein [Mucilaginibacter paludis]|uniref:Ig-like domain-containing protein n=1 Tax=Mucilaginibacter paludis DSM 18603 TaxID=714943 RepID=H1YBJ9_9SPHI|nr:T9SS C-terminal target domain-containing protein [Mucilaginibacter paludis]EHQ25070.1 hypothetical protein Mucpa_0889 [Mucilaginibacter paludis DSM 18603]
MLFRYLLLFFIVFPFYGARAQQDVDFHLSGTFLAGKNILKVKRDFNDLYLWILAQNNEVYRMNSVTKVVDDYSSQFSAYSGYQFIDIAGRSQDTVFIATNSSNVIEYKKGTYKLITPADGVPGLVNSIGIDYTGSYQNYPFVKFNNQHALLIATNHGLCRYDYKTELMLSNSSTVASRVFKATYRNELTSYLEFGMDPDPAILYPVMGYMLGLYGGDLWYGTSTLGYNLNCASYTQGLIEDNGYITTYMNLYWGTEKGLFQNNRANSKGSGYPHYHYLDGINVNAITSIYGLTAFGNIANPGLIKENLLVGTDAGLYFSNSGYQIFGSATLPHYTMFLLNDLGTKKINDICVNATSYAKPVCEDGAWIAATDGLYLITPNFAPYVNTANKLSAIQFTGQNPNISQLQICANTTTSASVLGYAYTGGVIQWYKDGQPMIGQVGNSLSIAAAGDYYITMYDPCSPVYFESNHLTVTTITAPLFTFNYPDQQSYCDGSTATLTTGANAAYQYRWYKDGVLNGNTTATLNTTISGKYKLEVSSCQGNGWVASKEVQLTFVKMPQPVITADKAAYCLGEQATLAATVPIDGSQIINWQAYQYRWYKDGVLNGLTTASIKISQPGKYKVEVLSCAGTWVASQETAIGFITINVPIITTDKMAYCIGDQATLKTSFVNDGTYTINWYRDGILIPSVQNSTSLTTIQGGNYTVDVASKLTSCSQSSAAYTLDFQNPPTVNLQQTTNTTLCAGQTVNLTATFPTGSTIKWSTGETTASISVTQGGTYSATVTSASGCTAYQSIAVQFLSNPVLALTNATLCQYTNETITLTAPSGFAKYEWNGSAGSSSFITGNIGKVSLKVTDHNGCTATQIITISSQCKDIHIPNTFTPNGDGQNDTWEISGLNADHTTNIKVYSRWGALVYSQNGYSKPWDGTSAGKKLPEGPYYYIISTHGAKQVLSGSVTLIY